MDDDSDNTQITSPHHRSPRSHKDLFCLAKGLDKTKSHREYERLKIMNTNSLKRRLLPRGEPAKELVEDLYKYLKKLTDSLGSESFDSEVFSREKTNPHNEESKFTQFQVKVTQREETVLFAIGCRELYSKQIQQIIQETTGKRLSEGSIYPIIKNLGDKELISGRWGDEKSNCGARRRYYKLTPKGWGYVRSNINSKFELLLADVSAESEKI
ncbi:MAG: helix-turn-helix transcriptional regulator [Prochloraceae cyanobacterium]|nr:helix-turn-helix transcriptional regulator [Prochloraceae cyanobacterium]